MAWVQCKKFGHSYDDALHSSCPHCGVEGINEGVDATWGKPPGAAAPPPAGAQGEKGHTVAHAPGGQRPGGANQETIHVWKKRHGFDPIVGWLVCIDGPDKGRDFRIRPELDILPGLKAGDSYGATRKQARE